MPEQQCQHSIDTFHDDVGDGGYHDGDDQPTVSLEPTCPAAAQTPRRLFTVPETSSGSPGVIVTDNMLALVDAFFDTLYPLPSFSFLHPGTTKKQCRDGQIHRSLASSICAITSLHLGHHRDTASQWTQDAEQSIWMRLEYPTIPLLQALLLIIYYRMESGNFQRAFMLTASAARFAAAMRLNHERPGLDPIVMETRRRIVWSLTLVERYFSVGLPEFEVCPIEAIYLSYPSAEEEYSLETSGERGAGGIHSRLEVVRRDTMKLTRNLAMMENPLASIQDAIRKHENTLSDIGSSMPNGTQLSPDQITDLLKSPWFSRHMAMHVSWHQAHCDLYRLLVQGYPEAAPSSVLDQINPADMSFAEQRCLEHASSAIDILTTVNYQSMSRHFLEFDIAICAYHATRLLLFISRFGKSPQRPTPEFAASRAELCLVALRRFYPNSLLVAPMIEELNYSIGVFSQQNHQLHHRHHQSQQDHSPAAPSLSSAGSSRDKRGVVSTSNDQDNNNSNTTSTGELGASPETSARQRLAVHSLLRQTEFLDGEDKTPPSDLASAEELSVQLTQTSKPTNEAITAATVTTAQPTPPNDDAVPQQTTPAVLAPATAAIVTPPPAVSLPTQQTFTFGSGTETRDWEFDAFGDVDHPLFSLCGPEDWEWLFNNDQWPK